MLCRPFLLCATSETRKFCIDFLSLIRQHLGLSCESPLPPSLYTDAITFYYRNSTTNSGFRKYPSFIKSFTNSLVWPVLSSWSSDMDALDPGFNICPDDQTCFWTSTWGWGHLEYNRYICGHCWCHQLQRSNSLVGSCNYPWQHKPGYPGQKLDWTLPKSRRRVLITK